MCVYVRLLASPNSQSSHALAAVSWMDHNVGVVLEALEDNGFKDNTVVAFFADHGVKF